MSEKYIEKILLYFVVLSFLVHLGVFAFFYFLPPEKPTVKQQPYMVELSDMPELKAPQTQKGGEAKRAAAKRRRVAKETAPKGESAREKAASTPRGIARPFPTLPPRRPVTPQQQPQGAVDSGKGAPAEAGKGEPVAKPPQRNAGLFKSKTPAAPDISKLFPSAGRLSKLEEGYRQKYGPEVAEGEAKFLNTEDIQFGSFLRRFETAVYGVWRYPGDAARMGIEGVTVVKITFNAAGAVEDVQILESSGSRILDDEVMRTLHSIGSMGRFPRGYTKEKFNLIAFFQYGIIRGTSRGTLH